MGSAEPWTMANGRYQPYMGNVNEEAMLQSRRQEIARRQALGQRNPFTSFVRDTIDTAGSEAVPGYIDRGRQSTAARFNRRYGSGGTRAIMGRGIGGFGARIGGMGRGIGSYYRGGGGSGVTGLLGAGIGLGGTMLGESIGGETGENISAFSQIGGGALSGASMGAMIGSVIPGVGTAIGAAVGAVIGGAMPLMDKGVRDAVGRFVKGFTDSATQFAKDLIDGAKNAVSGIFESITSINLGGLFQGGIEIPGFDKAVKVLEFIKSGLDKIFNPIEAIRGLVDGIKSVIPWGKKEVGGPVIKGTSYIVGERGPEIFTPGQSGTILTNRELMSLSSRSSGNGSSNVVFNVTINATGLAGNDIAAAIQPAVIKILDDGMKQASSSTVTRGTTVI